MNHFLRNPTNQELARHRQQLVVSVSALEPILYRPTLESEDPESEIADEGNQEGERPKWMMACALEDSCDGNDEEDERNYRDPNPNGKPCK